MSFKLVGDQYGEIRLNKRRRVDNLLLEGIPEGEAALTKNGRYVCLVCRNGPTFDTTDTLSLHRRGKKHATASRHKKDVEEESMLKKQKNEHESALDSSTKAAPLLRESKRAVQLLSNAPGNGTAAESGANARGNESIFRPRSSGAFGSTTRPRFPDKNGSNATKVLRKDPVYVFPWRAGVRSGKKPKGETGAEKAVSEAALEEQKRVRRLKEAGWLQSEDGTWSKDPNVEFDSDEEEPPARQL